MSHAAAYVFVKKYFTEDTETRVSLYLQLETKLNRLHYIAFLNILLYKKKNLGSEDDKKYKIGNGETNRRLKLVR